MKQILIFLFCILCITQPAISQRAGISDTIDHIRSYRDNVIKLINENKLNEINIKRYYSLNPGEYASIGFDEEEVLLLITKQYKVLLSDLQKRKTRFYKSPEMRGLERKDKNAKHTYKLIPLVRWDSLTQLLVDFLIKNQTQIKSDIVSSDCSNEEKDFLLLFSEYYLSLLDNCNVNLIDKLAEKSEEFHKKYPASEYRKFINDFINIRYVKGNWGYGLYLISGTALYKGGLENYFSSPFLIGGSIDINYKKLDLTFSMCGSARTAIRKEFYYDTIWKKDHKYNSLTMNSTIGYHIYENHRLNITPFIGFQGYRFMGYAPGDSTYYSNAYMMAEKYLVAGVRFDYKFGYGTCKSIYLNHRGGPMDRIFADVSLRLEYQNPKFDLLVPGLKGNLFMITLGFGFNEYPPRRIMKKK